MLYQAASSASYYSSPSAISTPTHRSAVLGAHACERSCERLAAPSPSKLDDPKSTVKPNRSNTCPAAGTSIITPAECVQDEPTGMMPLATACPGPSITTPTWPLQQQTLNVICRTKTPNNDGVNQPSSEPGNTSSSTTTTTTTTTSTSFPSTIILVPSSQPVHFTTTPSPVTDTHSHTTTCLPASPPPHTNTSTSTDCIKQAAASCCPEAHSYPDEDAPSCCTPNVVTYTPGTDSEPLVQAMQQALACSTLCVVHVDSRDQASTTPPAGGMPSGQEPKHLKPSAAREKSQSMCPAINSSGPRHKWVRQPSDSHGQHGAAPSAAGWVLEEMPVHGTVGDAGQPASRDQARQVMEVEQEMPKVQGQQQISAPSSPPLQGSGRVSSWLESLPWPLNKSVPGSPQHELPAMTAGVLAGPGDTVSPGDGVSLGSGSKSREQEGEQGACHVAGCRGSSLGSSWVSGSSSGGSVKECGSDQLSSGGSTCDTDAAAGHAADWAQGMIQQIYPSSSGSIADDASEDSFLTQECSVQVRSPCGSTADDASEGTDWLQLAIDDGHWDLAEHGSDESCGEDKGETEPCKQVQAGVHNMCAQLASCLFDHGSDEDSSDDDNEADGTCGPSEEELRMLQALIICVSGQPGRSPAAGAIRVSGTRGCAGSRQAPAPSRPPLPPGTSKPPRAPTKAAANQAAMRPAAPLSR